MQHPLITAETLRSMLHYCPESGVFTWLVDRPRVRAGTACTAKNKWGYVVIGVLRRYYSAHRLAWLYMTGEWPAQNIDHLDGRRDNNAWGNLRDVSQAVNSHNVHTATKNAHGHRGVYFHRRAKKWAATIRAYGKLHFLGYFITPEAAGEAYALAKARLHAPARSSAQCILIGTQQKARAML